MRTSAAMSASRGTLTSSRVAPVSRLAIISGSAAFLAPEIGIVPLSGTPPVMWMRSIAIVSSGEAS